MGTPPVSFKSELSVIPYSPFPIPVACCIVWIYETIKKLV